MAVTVHFLGAGDAFSAGGGLHAGYLVRSSAATFLLDCGATALAALKRDRLEAAEIDLILLSHLHGDHFAGLPYLLLEYTYERPRQRPLRIAGPPGTSDRVGALLRATYSEFAQRPLPFALEFTEFTPGVPKVIEGVWVEPLRVPHQERELSLALRLRVDHKVILYSGDTGWTEDLVAWSQGVDLFVCECSFYETRVDFHLDYPRLADNRDRFGARRLILTHLGREVLARRAQLAIEIAHEGLVVEV
ncbi:MAG: MBL fold metallo-hydrolase [Deltaproteobacteria bacterium]|nr:MBL fold metallo-hydrolase [Deltaproteobacteria bacterium]